MAAETGVLERAGAVPAEAAGGDLLPGAAAGGVLAGVAMLAFLAAAAALDGRPPLGPLELVAAMFAGAEGAPGAGALLGASLLWVVVSAALAVPFAAMVSRDHTASSAALLGMGYAAVVMAIATSVVLPWLNPEMRDRMPAMGGAWVIGYAVYGAGLGLVPWLRRRLRRR